MQHDTDSSPILPEADSAEVNAWLADMNAPVSSDNEAAWGLRALSGIYGISRVLRRLQHELEPLECQALAEAVECLSDEMLEKGCCA